MATEFVATGKISVVTPQKNVRDIVGRVTCPDYRQIKVSGHHRQRVNGGTRLLIPFPSVAQIDTFTLRYLATYTADFRAIATSSYVISIVPSIIAVKTAIWWASVG